MWVISGLLVLLLVLGAGIIAVLARQLVWQPAIRLMSAGRAQLGRAQKAVSAISARDGHPGVGPETNDRRSLELNGATDPRL